MTDVENAPEDRRRLGWRADVLRCAAARWPVLITQPIVPAFSFNVLSFSSRDHRASNWRLTK
jgi:hypothetical protein